ncbi:MAG: alpha/beta fold hydrolase [Bradyrhizobium sp.]
MTSPLRPAAHFADLIPGARYALMEGCGHWPQWEDPETFNRLHLDFLLGR